MPAATGNFVLDKGYRANAALTKFTAVKFVPGAAEPAVTPVTAITDQIAGVVQFGVATSEVSRGKGALVRTMGRTVMIAAGAIPVGSSVTINASGQALAAATGGRVIGVCDGAPAINVGDQCSVRLVVGGALSP